jgi:hypothetical protein
MKELDFLRELNSSAIADKPNYDYFSTQFNGSLPDSDTEGEMYWHGRLIGTKVVDPAAGTVEQYEITFLKDSYTEAQWRAALQSGDITIKEFKSSSDPRYTSEGPFAGNLDPHKVEYEGTFTGQFQGKDYEGQKIQVTHHIRRTYISYQTIVTIIP